MAFCFVNDFIDSLGCLAEGPEEIPIRNSAALIIQVTGSSSPIVFRDLPADDPKQRRRDIGLAESRLGWRPKMPIGEGLTQTTDYFRRALSAKD